MIGWLHTYMKDGSFRHIEALALCAGFLFFMCKGVNKEDLELISSFFKVSAAVVTASGVVAYNLRNRAVDFSKYLIAQSANYEEIARKTKTSCHRLTFIVFFSFISGVLCMIAGETENLCMMTVAGMAFICSAVWYAHIIFAFDELEENMLDTAMKKREREEEEKAQQSLAESKEKHPDNF